MRGVVEAQDQRRPGSPLLHPGLGFERGVRKYISYNRDSLLMPFTSQNIPQQLVPSTLWHRIFRESAMTLTSDE